MSSASIPANGSRRNHRLAVAVRYLLILLAAATMIVPFLWMVSTSLKPPGSVLTIPPEIIPKSPTLDSYRRVAETVPIVRMVANSLFVTVATVALQLVTCAMSAYAFARMRWKGRDVLFLVYLATLMVPGQVTITPLFILIKELGWNNSYQALILPAATSAFGTFLLRQAMISIPREYEEAAFLDGATHWTVFRTIVLPMSRTSLATLAVFSAMGAQSFLSASPEAAEIRVEANWELPAVTDQALLDSWLEQTPPDSREVVFEALDTLVTPPPFTNQALIQDELDTLFQRVLAGELTPEEALGEAKVTIEGVLNE